MTDRNELERLQPMTTEQKALALVNAVAAECGWGSLTISSAKPRYGRCFEALCRTIEAHEADNARNEQRLADQAKAFSDAAVKAVKDLKDWMSYYPDTDDIATLGVIAALSPFILPEPDPLVEALDKMLRRRTMHPDREVLADEAAFLTAELAARGWKMNLERIEQ